MMTKEQLAERKTYLGGSDSAAVLGLSRWRTPLEVWASKTGQIDDDDSQNLAMEVGSELEDLVCKLFTKRTGKDVRRVNETLTHPNYPFIRANIDRRIVGEDAILEAKTCSGWKAKEWSGEDIPQEYMVQAMHYLGVTGKSHCYVAVLIGGNQDFRIKRVDRDPMVIGEIMKKLAAFWVNFVEPKVMPSVITKHDDDVLFKLFPNGADDDPVQLGDDANRIMESIQGLVEDSANIDGQIDKLRNELKAMLKDKAVGVTDRFRVTWKNQTTTRIDPKELRERHPDIAAKFSKVTASRVLRFAAIKVKEAA